MSRNLILADLFLAILVVLGGIKIRGDWKQFKAEHNVASIQPKPETVGASRTAKPSTAPDANSWQEISNRDVFSFDRSDVPAVAAVTVVPKTNQPKPFLFGTMALGGPRMAMVGPGVAGNRSYRSMKVGDVIDGWKLVEIEDKSMVVESGGERQTVIMNDPSAQLPRDYSRTLGGAQNATVSAPRPPAPEVARPAPSSLPAQPSAAGAETGAPKTMIIKTPFGDKVVPVP